MRLPIWWPLLRMLWWVREAALGREVVPDVNWMLTISSLERGVSGMTCLIDDCEHIRSWNGVVAVKEDVSILPAELSTRMMFLSDGTDVDLSSDAERLGTIASRSVTFSLGGLKARFVSAPMTR